MKTLMPLKPAKAMVLLILDGFGARVASADNAISRAKTPVLDALWAKNPHTLIDASEHFVGLPRGQFGNSEVGHLNIGAGRLVYMDLTRIDHALETGDFQSNAVLNETLDTLAQSGRTLHVLGLLSPGGVHSHERHIFALLRLAKERGVKQVALHAFLDGRDVAPKSAEASIIAANAVCAELGNARIASLTGRYYAMDRDQRWERTRTAYDVIVEGRASFVVPDAITALQAAYARGESDEFMQATRIGPALSVQDGDGAVCVNFRADRARQITQCLAFQEFSGFARARAPRLSRYVCLSFYGDAFAHLPIAFRNEKVESSLGEVLAQHRRKQLRIAETEKYAHVTYFFSGGREQPFEGETRLLVPSPKVATYDLKPEMSAPEVSDKLAQAIASGEYAAMICNLANGDMVGHTGNLSAAILAVEALDVAVGVIVKAAQAKGVPVLLTADHGNCEQMLDKQSGQAHTQHTTNKVPALLIGMPGTTLRSGGALKDLAPTVLQILGLPQPKAMSGRSLIST